MVISRTPILDPPRGGSWNRFATPKSGSDPRNRQKCEKTQTHEKRVFHVFDNFGVRPHFVETCHQHVDHDSIMMSTCCIMIDHGSIMIDHDVDHDQLRCWSWSIDHQPIDDHHQLHHHRSMFRNIDDDRWWWCWWWSTTFHHWSNSISINDDQFRNFFQFSGKTEKVIFWNFYVFRKNIKFSEKVKKMVPLVRELRLKDKFVTFFRKTGFFWKIDKDPFWCGSKLLYLEPYQHICKMQMQMCLVAWSSGGVVCTRWQTKTKQKNDNNNK